MYLNEKKLNKLQVRNVLLTIFAIFVILAALSTILTELYHFHSARERLGNDSDMGVACIIMLTMLLLLFMISRSRYHIGNAMFFSSCFEFDLDGVLPVADLAAVTGMTLPQAERETALCIRRYMKNCQIRTESDNSKSVVLSSKKARCQCQSCGAEIEKSIYFTGTCAYCGSSDLTAHILTDNQFISISSDAQQGKNNPDFYTKDDLDGANEFYILAIDCAMLFLGIRLLVTALANYFNGGYSGEFEKLFTEDIAFFLMVILTFVTLSWTRFRKMVSVAATMRISDYFAKYSSPYIEAEKFPDLGLIKSTSSKIKYMNISIRYGYLRNCSFEMHNGKLTVALAKMVVKNQCPGCGAPITGAVDENYLCSYCGKEIMGVVVKK